MISSVTRSSSRPSSSERISALCWPRVGQGRGAAGVRGEAHPGVLVRHGADLRVVEVDEVTPRGQLRVGEGVLRRADAVGGHAGLDQPGLERFARLVPGPGRDRVVERGGMRASRVSGREARVGRPAAAGDGVERREGGVVRGGDRDPGILARAGEDARGCVVWMRVALCGHDAAVHRVVEDGRAEQVHGCLALGEVDVLPLAGAPCMIDGGQDRRDREAGGDVVRVGDVGRAGPIAGPARHVAEAGDRRAHRAVASEHAMRTGVAHE